MTMLMSIQQVDERAAMRAIVSAMSHVCAAHIDDRGVGQSLGHALGEPKAHQ
jgi:hypothetical protein